MRSVAEHRAAVLALATPLAAVERPLAGAAGCVLAAPVTAASALPPYDSSAMDGYGVRAADTVSASAALPALLTVVGTASAGHPATVTGLGDGECVRILTGAPVPPGVDAVVPVEATDGGRTVVAVSVPATVGAHIRRAGEELPRGGDVLPAGRRLTPAAVMAAAAAGAGVVSVVPPPRVAVVSTGDELAAPGEPLGPGRLPDSNGPGLAAAVAAAGGEVVAVERAGDDAQALAARLAELAERCDLLLTTGGVSAGAENDPVRAALEAAGAVDFVAVGMQPGKPQAAGRVGRAVFLGFPGNPVSSLVSWLAFGRPVLWRLAGRLPDDDVVPGERVAVLRAAVDGLETRQRFVRAAYVGGRADGRPAVTTLDGYGSHLVGGLGATDCFVLVPPGRGRVSAGSPVTVLDVEAT